MAKEKKPEVVIEDPKPAPTAEPAPVDVAAIEAELARAKADLAKANEANTAVKGNSDKLLTEKRDLDAKLKALGNYDDVVKILEAVKTVEEAQQIESGDVEKVYESRLGKFKADIHDPVVTERDDWKSKYEALKSSYQDKAKTDPLRDAWVAAKGKPEMFKYAVSDGKNTFRFDDNDKLVPYDADGNVIYGTGGTEPLSPEQWAAGFLLKEPDFKIPSQGTDAKGGGASKLTIQGNPWSVKYKGPDKYGQQLRIKKEAPQEAARLQREAKNKS